MKSSRNNPGIFQNIFKSHFGTSKVDFWTSKLILEYRKASPLPPAPLATSCLVTCRLEGFAGFERFPGAIGLCNLCVLNVAVAIDVDFMSAFG